ncbi:hypothetical protein EDC04DRAFT_2600755 [Pisolithus marmoratus]|nr:hypothetical protein EDC04DRAFT_2600755 [Pisolithus marmoratus]
MYDKYYEVQMLVNNVLKEATTQTDVKPREQVKQPMDDEKLVTQSMPGITYMPDAYEAISIYSGKALARVRNDPVWVIFASTTSRVADLTTPQHDASVRVSADGQLIYTPYSQLGWDQRADPLEGIAATNMAQASHIMGYSRALWKSIQEGFNKGREVNSVKGMIGIAINKLYGPVGSTNMPLVTFSHFLKALEAKILSGMIAVGTSGELVWKSKLADCQMISVIDYFDFVFGPNFWGNVAKGAKGAFKDASPTGYQWTWTFCPQRMVTTMQMSGPYIIGITHVQCSAAITITSPLLTK